MPYVLPLPGQLPARSEYTISDPEGAPDQFGRRHHAALDWFATAGTAVLSPVTGTVVEAVGAAGDYSGQVFGGTVKVREAGTGRVWVFRHVDPRIQAGRTVAGGTEIATVAAWADNPASSHAHIELWRSLAGGYRYENLVDPRLALAQGQGVQLPRYSRTDRFYGIGQPHGTLNPGTYLDENFKANPFAGLLPDNVASWLLGNAMRGALVVGGFALVLLGLLLAARSRGVAAPLPGLRAGAGGR